MIYFLKGVQSSPEARLIDASTTIGLKVSEKLTKDLIGERRFDFDPNGVLANFQAPNELCPFKSNLACNASDRFPPADGSCNNLNSPWLGKSETPYKRFIILDLFIHKIFKKVKLFYVVFQ